ncbi:MAG: HU family DNA-binding protein, partial [Solobacterium sp.]|nr:HU family DNA-binding protein [Solobacterium sp.]
MMENLNKKELAEIVADKHNLTKKEALEIVDLVFDT